MTSILALSTSSPLPEMICPSMTPSRTMKWDFSQLNTSHFLTQTSRILVRWAIQLSKLFPKTEKSSMRTSKMSLRKLEKIAVMHHWNVAGALHSQNGMMTEWNRKVVENTWSRVKTKSKLISFMKLIWIEGYNAKYGSNPHGIREIGEYNAKSLNLIKSHDESMIEIGENGIVWKMTWWRIHRIKKSMNLTLISWRNWRLKRGDIFKNVN